MEVKRPEPVWQDTWYDKYRDQLAELTRQPKLLAIGVLIIGVVGFGWWQQSATPSTAQSLAKSTNGSGQTSSPSSAISVTTSTGPSSNLTVHVAGAVVSPGVVVVPNGSRVVDAIERSGGATQDADLDQLNLAAKLIDGQKIFVVVEGQIAPADPAAATSTESSAGPVNLNTATSEQLESLPGIGPSLAEAIIKERDKRGGFRSVADLRNVRGIGTKRFDDLKDLVTV